MPGVLSAREMLPNGMRPESWTARDRFYLANCRNRRPTPDGLKHFFDFVAPVSDADITLLGETKAYPYPISFQGRSVSLLCFADAIYTVDSDGVPTLVDTKDPDDSTGSTSKAITTGSDWHFLDLGPTWMLFNIACVIWKTGRSSDVWVSDDVSIVTACVHRHGRVLMAGFDLANFYARADWPSYWSARKGQLPTEYAGLADAGMDTNWVRWGSYLAPDLLDLLDPSPLMDTDLALDLKWRHEAGGCALPWQGACYGLQELGDGVVAYGSGGVTFLQPVANRYAPLPFVGLGENIGIVPTADSGLPVTRTHWAGTKAVQYFVDYGGDIWRLTPDLRAECLGYKEFVSALERDTLMLVHDGGNDHLYIGDGNDCLLLQEGKGMCRAPHMPNRIVSITRQAVKAISFPTADPTTVEVKTGTFTTKSGHVETLARVWFLGLTTSGSDGWRIKIHYRTRAYDEFTTSDTFTPDARNSIVPNLPVLEWRYIFESTDQSKVTLEDIDHEFGDANPAFANKVAASVPAAESVE